MSRVSRTVVPGFPHHVTQRGNNRAQVFHGTDDCLAYLRLLLQHCREESVRIWAWCLMPNHIHLVAVPERESSLAKALQSVHAKYAIRYRRVYGGVGHLWQARFYSCAMDEEHLWAAVRYVERNPVRAQLTNRAWDYPWSSAPAHCGLRSSAILDPVFPPAGVIADWKEWLSSPEDEDALSRLRKRTHTGRPCGNSDFLKMIAKQRHQIGD